MPMVLVTLDEVREALQTIGFINYGGVDHIDAAELLRVVTELVTPAGVPAPTRETGVSSRDHLSAVPEPAVGFAPLDTLVSADDRAALRSDMERVPFGDALTAPTIEVAQAVLNATPRGVCVGCGHLDHFDGRCPDCECLEYVDSVVRDPMEYARDQMHRGANAPPWWPQAGEIQSMISVAESEGFNDGRLMHSGGPAQFAQPENINPNPPSFVLPPVE